VADGDIPLAYSVADVGQTLALPYRGGAIALFDVQRVQRVVGLIRLVINGQDQVPAYGELTVTARGRDLTSPVGSGGAFYFEDLPAGTHSASLRDTKGRECALTITVPSSENAVISLGTLRCEGRQP
jgi:outer membrane usher protein FimD/PapC